MLTIIDKRNRHIELTEDGFMVNRGDWDTTVAEILADKEGLKLGKVHWEVINFLIDYYKEYLESPHVNVVVDFMKSIYGEGDIDKKILFELFPHGPVFQGSRIAGLPRPWTYK